MTPVTEKFDDQIGQVARGDALARQIVEPDGDAGLCEGLEPFVHDQFSWMSGGGVSWAQLIVTPGWASSSAGPLGPLAAGCVGAVVPVDASRLSCAAVTTVSAVKPNFFEQQAPGRAGSVVVDADDPPGVTDEITPTDADSGLYRDARLDLGRDHGVLIALILLVEPLPTGH